MKNYYTDSLFQKKDYKRLGKYLKFYVELTPINSFGLIPYYFDVCFINVLTNKLFSVYVEISKIEKFENYFFVTIDSESYELIPNKESVKSFEISLTEYLNHQLEDFGYSENKVIYILMNK